MEERKLGRFALSYRDIREFVENPYENPTFTAILRAIQLNVVIIRTEESMIDNNIIYTAWSDKFESVPIGHTTPLYSVVVKKTVSPGSMIGYQVSFQKIENATPDPFYDRKIIRT